MFLFHEIKRKHIVESIMDQSLTDYATEHQELPLLIRWTGERAVGLFEEWRLIEEEKRSDMEKMTAYHNTYRLYMIPTDEFGLYYMCFGKEQAEKTVLPPDMDPEQAKLIKDSLSLPYVTRLNKYIPTLQEHIREYSEYSTQQFYQTLRERRERFHRLDSVLVTSIRTMNEMLETHIRDHPVLACITITDLFEELPYTSSFDLWHHFDRAQLSISVPFCTYSGFYKMLDHVSVKPEWSSSSTTCMTVYVQKDQHEHCIYMYPDNVVIQSKFQANGETPMKVIQLINDTFDLELVQQPTHQKKIQAICYVDSPLINLKLLLFFIYQDPLFSRYLFAEERLVVMKDKTYLYFTYYPNPRIPTRFISFTMRNVYKEEADRLTCDLPGRVNKTFMRVKIRHCNNQADINTTLQMLTLLFERYKTELTRLQSSLRSKRIPLPEMKKTVLKRSTKPKLVGLVHGSIRNQPNAPRRYTIDEMKGHETEFYHVNIENEPYVWVNEQHLNQQTNEDGSPKPHVMIFPTDPDEQQYFYVCDKPGYPFINLHSIKVQSQKVLVPYCFITPQTLTQEEKEEKTGTRPIKTGKTLKIDQLGEVLSWMTRWFQIIQPTYQLIRRGISLSPLDSVLYVLECAKMTHVEIPEEEHIQTVKQTLLTHLRDDERYLNEIMTEAYGQTREELLQQFETGYIDPRVFYSFLCRMYSMNIILFCKNGVRNEDHFYLSLPRYALSPTYSMTYEKTVGIVINQGNEFNKSKYPLCEQVAITSFEPSIVWMNNMVRWIKNPFVGYIHKTQQELYGVTMYQPPELFHSTHQTLDEYGHVSWLHTERGSIRCMTPIHSQWLPLLSSDHITYWTEKDITDIHKLLQITTDIIPTQYGDYKGETLEIDNHTYFFPTEYKPSTTLQDYRLFEKTSRYLQEYVQYGFSKYLSDHPDIPSENMFAEMDAFATDFFVITGEDNDSTYIQQSKTVQRDFSLTNGLYDGEHLTIPSEYVRKKLMYVLVNAYRSQRNKLLHYHNETNMNNYYVHVWDCIAYPYHHIVTGESAYLTYATHRSDTIKHGSHVLRPTSVNPYVLYVTQSIRNKTSWLMQYVSSVNEALVRYDRWIKHRVNHFNPDDEWEGPDGFHQIVWSNESTFTYYPYLLDTHDHAVLSIIHVSDDKCIVQVMLPM